jgi:hypothetical protein
MIAGADLADQAQCVLAKGRGRIAVGRIDDVDQVVRTSRTLFPRRFGRSDIHIAEHQRRIEADDLDRSGLGEGQRAGGLAAGRGADQGKGVETGGRRHGRRD